MRAIIDWERSDRTGLPEAVFAEGKSLSQLSAILFGAIEINRPLLITRISGEFFASLPPELRKRIDFDEQSRTAILGSDRLSCSTNLVAGILTGGLGDLPVALEAQRTLTFMGIGSSIVADIGVAGLWRLMSHLGDIRKFDVLIVLAGMEGALFSVLAGLVRAPIIAVPTSIGAGVTQGGHVALMSALGSCAPGLVVVNIDNGFGAAQAAARIVLATNNSINTSEQVSSVPSTG